MAYLKGKNESSLAVQLNAVETLPLDLRKESLNLDVHLIKQKKDE